MTEYEVELTITSVAEQKVKGMITQEQLDKYMEHFDEHYLRIIVTEDDKAKWSEYDYDCLDLEEMTIKGGPYEKDYCWVKGQDLENHPYKKTRPRDSNKGRDEK